MWYILGEFDSSKVANALLEKRRGVFGVLKMWLFFRNLVKSEDNETKLWCEAAFYAAQTPSR